MNLAQLRALWAAALAKAESIRNTATTEARPMTEQEQADIRAALADMDRLGNEITLAQDLEARRTAADQTLQRQQNNRPGAPAHVEVSDNEEDRPYSAGIVGFGEMLQEVRRAADTGSDLSVLPPRLRKRDLRNQQIRAAAGMSETIASDGGFLVNLDAAPLMQKEAFDTSVLAKQTNNIPLTSNANGIKIPYIDETSRATGSRWGGIRVYWQDEAEATTASKPKFGKLEMNLKKLMGLCYITDEALQDAGAAGTIMQQAFSEEFAFALDDAVFRGGGAGNPLGFMNSGCKVSVAKETSQASATILYANLSKMRQRMLPRAFATAAWYVNIDTMPQLEQLVVPVKNVAGTENVGGLPVSMPNGGTSVMPYGTLFGRPIVPIEQCETLGTEGDIVLANLGYYAMITKGGIQAAQSIHVKFLTDEMAFRFILRTDGQPVLRSAITPYKGTGTLSAFVTLATR